MAEQNKNTSSPGNESNRKQSLSSSRLSCSTVETDQKENDIIAADMNKYDSPLADLDREHVTHNKDIHNLKRGTNYLKH